jgi:AraC-like DNA-binding protein
MNHSQYSERSIQLIFKKHFNLTPFEYIEEQRLLKAYELIKKYKNTKNISDVATEVGLNHLGRFSVKFRKRFEISPSQHRKNLEISKPQIIADQSISEIEMVAQ